MYSSNLPLPTGRVVLLVGSSYDNKQNAVVLKFYDPELHCLYEWRDLAYRPYCYTKLQFEERLLPVASEKGLSVKRVEKRDVIEDRDITVLKITGMTPLDIGGRKEAISEQVTCWEADVRYHDGYLADKGLIVGTYYTLTEQGTIEWHRYALSEVVQKALQTRLWDKLKDDPDSKDPEYRFAAEEWAQLLNQPVPEFKRVAIDIEVEVKQAGRMPSPREPESKITAIGFSASDGWKAVFVLADPERNESGREMPVEAVVYVSEKEMIKQAFEVLSHYPVVITFNGDGFDLPYLFARAQSPKIDVQDGIALSQAEIPIIVKDESFSSGVRQLYADPVYIRGSLHLDIYRFLQNKSVQNYAFSKKYSEYTLDAVAWGLLKDRKEEYEGELSDLSMQALATYCLKDADLTLRLTTFGDSVTMKLLVSICRIGRLSLEDVDRTGVNQWIKGILYFEHRQRNELIPNEWELESKGSASTVAVIKEKKYRGADVVDPTAGIHFNVVVVDFASLYPSIIKTWNLSHETINCPHRSCRMDPDNVIPETRNWVCSKRRGLTSLLIGSLRDLRVNYYKYLSKDKSLPEEERNLYTVVSQALKVIMNASYGVMGAPIFALYCLPVADSVTAIGRATINSTILEAKKIGIVVLYGDTDSVFLKNPSKEWIEKITDWAHSQLNVDLEVDKSYRYVVFSKLKKNYVGVLSDGTVDVKGLTGKKSHTPPYVRETFYTTLDLLKEVHSESDWVEVRKKIKSTISARVKALKEKRVEPSELVVNVMLGKNPERYKRANVPAGESKYKGVPAHIKAALMLMEHSGRKVRAGDKISYVKTRSGVGVAPLAMASKEEIDTDKYMESMKSTLEQLTTSLDLTFDDIMDKPRQISLDGFWAGGKIATQNQSEVT